MPSQQTFLGCIDGSIEKSIVLPIASAYRNAKRNRIKSGERGFKSGSFHLKIMIMKVARNSNVKRKIIVISIDLLCM